MLHDPSRPRDRARPAGRSGGVVLRRPAAGVARTHLRPEPLRVHGGDLGSGVRLGMIGVLGTAVASIFPSTRLMRLRFSGVARSVRPRSGVISETVRGAGGGKENQYMLSPR